MKKLATIAAGILLIIGLSTAASFANSETNEAANMLPEDTIFLTTLNPTPAGSSLKEVYETYLVESIADMIGDEFESYMYENYDDIMTLLEENVADNELSISSFPLDDSTEAMCIMLEMDEEDYTTLETLLQEYLVVAETDSEYEINYVEIDYGDSLIYYSSIPAYFSYKDGHLIIVEDYQEGLEEILAIESDSLSSNEYYQEAENEFLVNNFWDLYVDMDYVYNTYFSADEDLSIMGSMWAYGMSVKKTSTGFKMQNYTSNNEDILETLGIDYSDTNAVPSIYEFMPSERPMMYFEMFNLSESWETLQNSSFLSESDVSEIETEIFDETSIDLESEILTALEQGFGFLIQDSEETLPTLTIMADVDENETAAEALVSKLVDYIWSFTEEENNTYTITEEDLTIAITKAEEEMLGGTMTTFQIDISENESENPYSIHMPEGYFDMEITIGVTGDDILLFSTSSNIEDSYGEDLSNYDTFDEMFLQKNENTTSIGYFDFGNTGIYIKDLLSEIEDAAGEEFSEFESAQESIDDFVSLFDAFFTKSLSTNDYSENEMEIRLDLDGLLNIGDYFTETNEETTASYEVIANSHKEFDDVDAEEWYGDDIYYLTTEGVINGYPDGTFMPGNEITRAEFVTILMKTLYEKGYFADTCEYAYYCAWNSGYFEDVNTWDWSAEYVYTARELGIAEGYEDGTLFKPNESITRAEAITMVSRAIALIEIDESTETSTSELAYTDVEADSWYYDAVWTANYYKLINEDGDMETFDPTRPINRAESSKLIKKMMDIIQAN